MKKSLLALLLTFFSSVCLAQKPTVSMKNFNTLSITGLVGTNTVIGDVSDNKAQANSWMVRPVYGLTLSKQISHFLSLEVAYLGGSAGTKNNYFSAVTHYDSYEGRLRFNLTNGQIISTYQNTQLFFYLGAGMINYRVNQPTSKMSSDWVHIIPVGIGAKRRLSDHISLNLEASYTAVNTDYLDGIKKANSKNDGLARASIGLQYTFGKRKNLEWDRYTDYFNSSEEHSVDTVVVIKRNVNIDTLVIKIVNDSPAIVNEKNVINFDFNKWNVKNKYFESLDDLADKMIKGEINSLVLDGHSDSIGTEEAKLNISQRRAEAVERYLVSKGVKPRKITIILFGSINPISNDPSKNRRVEIKEEK